jgi:hypothetical protein
MILKNHLTLSKKQGNTKFFKWIGIFTLIATLVGSLYYIVIHTQEEGIVIQEKKFILLGDAETVKNGAFVFGKTIIKGGYQQSKEFAYKGKHSVKLQGPKTRFGFGHTITGVQPGDQLIARVWMYSPDGIRACVAIKSTEEGKPLYFQGCEPIAQEGDWKLLEVIAKVTHPIKDNTLKIYCYNSNLTPVYFDNLAYFKTNKPIAIWKPESVHVFIKEGEFTKLKNKREEALDQGMLLTTDDSWVKGAIHSKEKGGDNTKISLRLKGDWLDHLEGDKWSFRVKTETNKSWKRLKTFSLQDPLTRSYLKEWILHKFFDYEDILTTRYDFVELVINNEEKGLYAYEEHFLKQIPEFNLRREGPIVKFTENGLWEARLNATKLGVNIYSGEHKANPDIRPFGENKILNSPALSQQYKIAQNLCYQYQFGLKGSDEIFNLDLMAKYYAIMDITGGHHGVIWHNQRFYYNPVIGKLEPIGFDGYDKYGNSWVAFAFIGYNFSTLQSDKPKEWHARMFMEPAFLKKYIHYLNKFSQKEYINEFIDEHKDATRKRLIYIQQVSPDYRYSMKYLYQRAASIQEALLPTSASVHTRTVKAGYIAVCNKHGVPIEIMGTATAKKGMVSSFEKPHLVYTTSSYKLTDFSNQLEVSKNAKFIVYRVIGLENLHYTAINPWPVPTAYTPMQELKGNLIDNHTAYYYDKENKSIVFKDSSLITEPIIIPKDHRVKIEAGAYMDIVKKAFVISYSAVQFMGDEVAPIVVNSSDGTANGFTVLQAKNGSNVNYTTFLNMNTLAYKGWNLTGAVTFYESDVEIRKSVFTKNNCEDALNIIRSKFLFIHSTVSHTYSDGFDADFCTGDVLHSYFYNTGNDGIDFSTSKITIEDCRIEKAGDKGISIGEEGIATIINTLIDGAVIGIASKDFSKVLVKSVTLKNCEQGFSAYQKKPEYGGGIIVVEDYTAKNVQTLYKILPGSYLKLIDKEIKTD